MSEPVELLVILAPARRRDDIVDVLMATEGISGFSFTDCGGFSREHGRLNLREQVQGYGDSERFEILCAPSQRAGVLARLGEIAGADAFRYWVTPVSVEGHIGPARQQSDDLE